MLLGLELLGNSGESVVEIFLKELVLPLTQIDIVALSHSWDSEDSDYA
jgi:hypothetical protein